MRGARWMREASYLTDTDRDAIMRVVEKCKRYCRFMKSDTNSLLYNERTVGVRPSSYTGEPHPIAMVTFGPRGCSLYEAVYRPVPVTEHVREQINEDTCEEHGRFCCAMCFDMTITPDPS